MKNSVLDFEWKFVVHQTEFGWYTNGWFIHVEFTRPDIITGKLDIGKSRKEFIEEGTSLSGVVKTCWLLLELMVRHELMESFKYQGKKIFNPHNSVLDLMKIQEIHDVPN